MTALKLDMQIPVGDGRVCLLIDIPDITRISPAQRDVITETGKEWLDFATQAMTEYPAAATTPPPAAEVHDPNPSVLAGVTGSRIRDKL